MANLSLGSNIKLVDWAPQNDVLGHPAVKAFVTHAGINSVYEAAYHAKPVVAVPLIADQPENAVKVNQTNLLIAGRCVIASACCQINAVCLRMNVWLLATLLVDSEHIAIS